MAKQDNWGVVGEGVFGQKQESQSAASRLLSLGDQDATYEMLSKQNPIDPTVSAARESFMQNVDAQRAEQERRAQEEAAAKIQAAMGGYGGGGYSAPAQSSQPAQPQISEADIEAKYAGDIRSAYDRLYAAQGMNDMGTAEEAQREIQRLQNQMQAEKDRYAAQAVADYKAAQQAQAKTALDRKAEQIGLFDLQEADEQALQEGRQLLAQQKEEGRRAADPVGAAYDDLYAAMGKNDQAAVEDAQRRITQLTNPTKPVTLDDLYAERDRLEKESTRAFLSQAQSQEIHDSLDKVNARIEQKEIEQQTGAAQIALEAEIQTYHDMSALTVEDLEAEIHVIDTLISFAEARQAEITGSVEVRTGRLDKTQTNWQKWVDEEARLRELRDEAVQRLEDKTSYESSLSDADRQRLSAIEEARRNLEMSQGVEQEYKARLSQSEAAYREAQKETARTRLAADAYAWKAKQAEAAVNNYYRALEAGADQEETAILYAKAAELMGEMGTAYETLYDPYAKSLEALNQATRDLSAAAQKYNTVGQKLEDRIGAYYKAYDAYLDDKTGLSEEYHDAYENMLGLTALIDGYQEKLDALYLEQNELFMNGEGDSPRAQQIQELIREYDAKVVNWMTERANYYSYAYTYDYTRTLGELSAEDRALFDKIAESGYVGITMSADAEKAREQLLAKYGEREYARIAEMVQRDYNAKQSEKRQKQIEDDLRKYGLAADIGYSAASVISNLLSAPGAFYEIVKQGLANTGTYRSIDTNALGFAAQNFTRETRGLIGEQIGNETGQMLYSTLMSGLDSAAAMITGNAIGAGLAGLSTVEWTADAIHAIGGYLLGATAAANSMQDIAERGGDFTQIMTGGLMAGVFECFFEEFSIENFYSLQQGSAKELLGNILKSMVTNASEEANTELANIAYDFLVMGSASEWRERFEEIKRTEGLTDAQAYKVLAAEMGTQIGESALSGAIMGAGFGLGGNVRAYVADQRITSLQAAIRDIQSRSEARQYIEISDRNESLLPEYRADLTYKAGETSAEEIRGMAQEVYDAEAKQNADRKRFEAEHPQEAAEAKAAAQEQASVRVRTTADMEAVREQAAAAQEAAQTDMQAAEEKRQAQEAARIDEADVSRETTDNTAQAETVQRRAAAKTRGTAEAEAAQRSAAETGTAQRSAPAQTRGTDSEESRWAREEAQDFIDEQDQLYKDDDVLARIVETKAQELDREGESGQAVARELRRQMAERQAGTQQAEAVTASEAPAQPAVYTDQTVPSAQAETAAAANQDIQTQVNRILDELITDTKSDAEIAQDVNDRVNELKLAGNDELAEALETEFAREIEEDREVNNGRVYSDRDGRRDAGPDSAERRAGVGEGTGTAEAAKQNAAVRGQGGNGQAERIAYRVDEAQRKNAPYISMDRISMRGDAAHDVRDITDTTTDEELVALKDRAERDGIDLRIVLGGLRFKGMEKYANGYFNGRIMVIRADSRSMTATQIYDHEYFHNLKNDHPGLVTAAYDALAEAYEAAGYDMDALDAAYSDAYEGAYGYMDPEERQLAIMEEMCADFYAGFARNVDTPVQAQEAVRQAVQERTGESYREARPEATQTQQETRERWSIENTRNMSWGQQLDKYFTNKSEALKSSDMLYLGISETYDDDLMSAPLTLPQSVINKAMRAQKGSRSAHNMERGDFTELDKIIKKPAAVVINPKRNALVYLTGQKAKNGEYIIATFERNAPLFGENTHKATSIHTRKSVEGLLNNLDYGSKVIIYNKKALNQMLPGTEIQSLQLLASVKYSNSVTHSNHPVKESFSLEETDDQGRELSREQADFFANSTARDENGNLLTLYHGTKKGGFTVFKDWAYLTADRNYAERYADRDSGETVYEVYANIEKPFDTRIPEVRDLWKNEYFGNYSRTELQETGLPDWTDGYDLAEWIEEEGLDFDAILLDEGADPGKNGDVHERGISYVVRSSEQIKNVDNRTPTEDRDIRFALDDAPDSETVTGELTREVEAGDPADDAAKEPTLEDKIRAAAADMDLDDWTQKAYDDALAKGDKKTADLIRKQRAAGQMAKDLRRQANREKAAYAKDKNTAHLERVADLRKQANEYAKKEREYAKQTNVKTAPSPAQTIRRTADSLVKMFQVRADQRYSYRQQLQSVLEAIYRKGYVGDNDVGALFRAMFDDAVDTVNPDPAYEEVAEMMRDRHIYVSDAVRAEFGDDWEHFRRAMWGAGMIASSNDADREVDDYYNELSQKNPGLFDPEIADGAVQLQAIYDAVKLGKPKEVSLREAYQMQGLDDEALFETLYNTAEGILQQFANTADIESRLTREADENETRLKGKLRDEQAVHKQRLEDARAAFAAQQRRRQTTEKMNQIRSALKMLRRMSKENNANFIRAMSEQDETTQKIMRAALESINTVANSMTDRTLNNIRDLRSWYQQYKENNPNFVSLPGVENAIDRLDEVNLSDISVEELEILYNVIRRINHALESANNLIEEGREIALEEAGTAMRRETERAKGKTNIPILKNFSWNEDSLSLSRGLKRLGGYDPNSQMWKTSEAYERGDMDAYAYQEGADMILMPFLARRNNEANRKWLYKAAGEDAEFSEVEVPRILGWDQGDQPISDESGLKTIKLKLTQMQLVQMYLDLRNEDNLRHVKYGGYTIPDPDLYKKGKIAEAKAHFETVKMGPDTIRRIVDENLKPEGKAFAELLDRYYNVYAKNKMNQISRRLDGVDKAIGNHYYPILTSGTDRASAFNFFDGTIAGMGLLKTRQMYAANPILLQDADSTYQWHRDMMAKYVGYAIPTRDFKALLAYKPQGSSEVNQTGILKKFGADANKWLEDFFRVVETGDLENAQTMHKLVGNYVGQVLNANISSMLKQFAAIALAGSSYGQGSILRGLTNLKAQIKTDPEIIRIYTPYLDMRNQEIVYDQVTDIVRKKAGSVGKIAWQTALGRNWMNATDYLANRLMWAAAEDVVHRQNPNLQPGTEAEILAGKDLYYKEVARVFNRMTFDTQTNSNMMSKPNILRRKDSSIRALTMFRTDALQVAGLFREAVGQAQWAKENGTDKDKAAARKKVANTVAGILTSTAVSSMMGIIASMIRRRDKDLKDEEGNYDWRKIGKTFGVEAFKSLASSVLMGSEIATFLAANLIEGEKWFDLNNVSLDAINGLVSSLLTNMKKLVNAISRFSAADKDADYWFVHYDDITAPAYALAKELGHFFGVPIGNMEKNILGLIGWINPATAVAMNDWVTESAKKDLSGKQGDELRATLKAYLSDEIGRVSEDAIDEYLRLYEAFGSAVLPGANAPASYTTTDEDGNEVTHELTLHDVGTWDSTYRENMIDLVNALVNSDAYAGMTDDEKKKMLAKVASYSAEVGKIAVGADADGWVGLIRAAVDEGADLDDALMYYTLASWITSDRDEDGKEIRSAESKRMELLAGMDLTDAERGIMLKSFEDTKKINALKDKLSNGDLWTVAQIIGGDGKTADHLTAIAAADIGDEDKITVFNELLSDAGDEALSGAQDRGVSLERFAEVYALGDTDKVNTYLNMVDKGMNPDIAYKVLQMKADIKVENDGDEAKNMQVYRAIAESDLSTAEKWDTLDAMTKQDGPTAEKLHAARASGATIDQYLDLRENGESTLNTYLDATRLGMSSEAAYKAVMAVKDLPELPEGQKYGTTDKQKAAVRACNTIEDQILAYAAFSDKDQEEGMIRKFNAAKDYGVTPTIYMDYLDVRVDFDEEGKGHGNYSQKEVVAALDSMDLTKEQKAVLWQMSGSNWSTKNNPYSSSVGSAFKDAQATASAEVTRSMPETEEESASYGDSETYNILRDALSNSDNPYTGGNRPLSRQKNIEGHYADVYRWVPGEYHENNQSWVLGDPNL